MQDKQIINYRDYVKLFKQILASLVSTSYHSEKLSTNSSTHVQLFKGEFSIAFPRTSVTYNYLDQTFHHSFNHVKCECMHIHIFTSAFLYKSMSSVLKLLITNSRSKSALSTILPMLIHFRSMSLRDFCTLGAILLAGCDGSKTVTEGDY